MPEWNLPEAAEVAAVMRIIAPARRIRTRDEFDGRWWLELRYRAGRGWWPVLWPWPQRTNILRDGPYRQCKAGETVPVFCPTRDDAEEWGWCLAAMHEYPENEIRRRYVSVRSLRKAHRSAPARPAVPIDGSSTREGRA